MPSKKSKKNSYFYFMREYKQKEAARGNILSMNDLNEICGPKWRDMNAEARAPYVEMANKERRKEKLQILKCGSGENSDLRRQQDDLSDLMDNMNLYIDDILKKDFSMEFFNVIVINYYCHVLADDFFVPAEIAIVKFSLKTGVLANNIFNVIIDPVTLPVGYTFSSKKLSEETHRIPLPPHPHGEFSERNEELIYDQIMDFLKNDTASKEPLPPLFADETDLPIVENVFSRWQSLFTEDNPLTNIKVYKLNYLFFSLRNAAHKLVAANDSKHVLAFPYPTIAQNELDKDVYDSVTDIACDFHVNSDAYLHCAQARCIRKVYTICDQICDDLNIRLLPGFHVPQNAILDQRPGYRINDLEDLDDQQNILAAQMSKISLDTDSTAKKSDDSSAGPSNFKKPPDNESSDESDASSWGKNGTASDNKYVFNSDTESDSSTAARPRTVPIVPPVFRPEPASQSYLQAFIGHRKSVTSESESKVPSESESQVPPESESEAFPVASNLRPDSYRGSGRPPRGRGMRGRRLQ